MKKILFVSALAVGLVSGSASAATTTICSSATPQVVTAPAAGTAGTHYMLSAITPKCSTNVMLKGKDGTGGSTYGVAANSIKGKTTYKGDTSTGGIGQTGTACATAGACTSAEVDTALALVAS
jgi:hypothetical protein